MNRIAKAMRSEQTAKLGRGRRSVGVIAAIGVAVALSTTAPTAAQAYTGGHGCISVSNSKSGDWLSTTWTKQLKNNCSSTKRVKVQYWSGWSNCATLSSFASYTWTARWFHLSNTGTEFNGQWNYC